MRERLLLIERLQLLHDASGSPFIGNERETCVTLNGRDGAYSDCATPTSEVCADDHKHQNRKSFLRSSLRGV